MVAVDDSATTDEGTPVVINVLNNDSISCTDPDTMYIVTVPTRGSVVVNGDGTVTYTPDADECDFVDSFEYMVCCDTVCESAWVYVTVECTDAPEILIVNGFTPNGDGINDVWEILPVGLCDDITVQVYNRWGDIVYKGEGYTNTWDGRWQKTGEALPDGTYYYIVRFGEDCTGEYMIKTTKEGEGELRNISGTSIAGFVTIRR